MQLSCIFSINICFK